MKKLMSIVCIALVLAGCAGQQEYETVSDVYESPQPQPAMQIQLTLPGQEEVAAMSESSGNRLYFCDGYAVTVQTMDSGDLTRTLRSVTGFSKEQLTLLEHRQGQLQRYDCVWTCAGEGGDQVCRASILDDGSYHYVLTVMSDAHDAGNLSEQWQKLFDSFGVG